MPHPKTWLILDVNYLAYRAFYSTGGLKNGNDQTGTVFGILRDLLTLRDQFITDRFAFCFDYGKSLRKQSLPTYKASREEKERSLPEEEQEARGEMRRQVRMLRDGVLKEVGFQNVFYQFGYEADDCIASACEYIHSSTSDDAIIVSADEDMFQCLREDRVTCWNPTQGKMTKERTLFEEYGVTPEQWSLVKAIGGCKGDDVVGIKGVKEKTAAKFITGKLATTTKTYGDIVAGDKVWNENLKYVRLPYSGTATFKVQDDQVDPKAWDRLTERLGMKSLFGRY